MATLSSDNGLGDKLKDVVDAGQEKLEAAKVLVLDGTDRARHRVIRLLDGMTATIKEHPFMAVGVALGIGYVGTRLLRRR